VVTELSPEQRGTYARQLKDNPVLAEIFKTLRDEAFRVWSITKTDDPGSREYLYKHFQAVSQIERRINGYIANASVDEHNETQRLKMSQPSKRDDK
jgi:hypothetical protein